MIYFDSRHYVWQWGLLGLQYINEFITQGHAGIINNGELESSLILC